MRSDEIYLQFFELIFWYDSGGEFAKACVYAVNALLFVDYIIHNFSWSFYQIPRLIRQLK